MVGHQTKWEYLRAIYERYRQAGHRVKHVILNEFCLNTGYHRKYAIRLPPEIRDSASARSAPRKAARWAGAATCAALWPGNTVHSDGRLGSGRLPVVGAAEGAVADLDAVDAKAVSAERSDGAATSVHQSPADGSPTAGQEDPAEEAHLWPHQARPSAQAPHPGEDG